ncbi:unnamed protein product [Prunus armeniaca]
MSRYLSSVLPLILLMLVALIISVEAGLLPKKRTVRITNALGVYGDLVVHCKSKDDDLGDRVLHPGESFEFPLDGQESFITTMSTEQIEMDVANNCYPWPVQSGKFINP